MAVTKIPEKNNLKEERFIVAHSFKGFSSWSLDFGVSEHCGKAVHGGRV
jgi:hypothetical protein